MGNVGAVQMEWLVDDTIDPNAQISLARMTIAPGATSEAHRHPNCAETIHVQSGSIEQRIGDDWISARKGETLVVPHAVPHQTRNTGKDDAVLIIAYSTGSRVYEVL